MEFNTKTNAGQISPVLETGFLIVFDWGAGHFAHNPALSLYFSWLLIMNSRSREVNYISDLLGL